MKMLVTVNISKGFARWKEMARSLNPEMEKVGVKMVWAGTNPDESKIFMVVDMQDPSQMQSFGERVASSPRTQIYQYPSSPSESS